jgi:cytochrome P450
MDTVTGPSPALPRIVADPAQVRAILADPDYRVPDPGRGAPSGTLAWLRQNVARLSNGADHERRRELAEDLLRRVDPAVLRAGARDATNAAIDGAGGRPFDAMTLVARQVPVRVLATALDVAHPEQATGQLAAVAAAFLPGTIDRGTADGSVARLAELLPAGPDEQVAARIGLLVQAYESTAGLIGNAVAAAMQAAVPGPAADVVAQTVRSNPPVRFTRRVTPSGETIALDLTSARDDPAGHLAFGSGPRACPGAAHAGALAEGAVGPLLSRCRGTGAEVSYPEPPAPHVPVSLELTER